MFTSFPSRRRVRKKEKPLVREAERLQNLPSLYPRPHTRLPGGAAPSRLCFSCCLMAVHSNARKLCRYICQAAAVPGQPCFLSWRRPALRAVSCLLCCSGRLARLPRAVPPGAHTARNPLHLGEFFCRSPATSLQTDPDRPCVSMSVKAIEGEPMI